MKKILTIAAAFTLFAGALTGCGGAGSSSEAGMDNKKAEGQQTVATDGSTSMEKVIGFLSEAYMEEHGDVKVTYNPTGSSAGIQAVAEGRCDIGLASRNLFENIKSNERPGGKLQDRGRGKAFRG